MKKSNFPVVFSVLLALAVILACGWLFLVKPLLTFKNDLEAVQNEDGTYNLTLSAKTGNSAAASLGTLNAQRNGTLYAGNVNISSNSSTYGFYFDSSDRNVLLEIGPVLNNLLPEKAKKIDSVLGITASLNDKYVSLNQVAEIVGTDNITSLAGIFSVNNDTTGETVTELVSSVKDIITMIQDNDMSVRPLFSTKVLAQQGLETDGYYFFVVPQDTFEGTLYIGCGKSSANGIIRMQAFLDYTDESRMDEHVMLFFAPQEVSLTLPDSVLSQDDVDTLKQLVELYINVTGSSN